LFCCYSNSAECLAWNWPAAVISDPSLSAGATRASWLCHMPAIFLKTSDNRTTSRRRLLLDMTEDRTGTLSAKHCWSPAAVAWQPRPAGTPPLLSPGGGQLLPLRWPKTYERGTQQLIESNPRLSYYYTRKFLCLRIYAHRFFCYFFFDTLYRCSYYPGFHCLKKESILKFNSLRICVVYGTYTISTYSTKQARRRKATRLFHCRSRRFCTFLFYYSQWQLIIS